VVWWGAEYQAVSGVPEAGFYTTSFFDSGGNALPALDVLGQLTAPALLKMQISATTVLLTWPLSAAGMELFASTNLQSEAQWTPMSNSINTSIEGFTITMPFDGSQQRFFRLQR
jgi:hypothetical protein